MLTKSRLWGALAGIAIGLLVVCVVACTVLVVEVYQDAQARKAQNATTEQLVKDVRAYEIANVEIAGQAIEAETDICKAVPSCRYTVPELTVKIVKTRVVVTVKK
jgi:hypothetical protein